MRSTARLAVPAPCPFTRLTAQEDGQVSLSARKSRLYGHIKHQEFELLEMQPMSRALKLRAYGRLGSFGALPCSILRRLDRASKG